MKIKNITWETDGEEQESLGLPYELLCRIIKERRKMKKLLILSFILLVSACSCDGKQKQLSKYISEDSTLVFTFVNDSLYVDTYESGCGIEQYRLEVETETRSETIYKAYEFVLDNGGTDRQEIHYIRLSKDPMGAHWEYRIKFDDEGMIPIIKINS